MGEGVTGKFDKWNEIEFLICSSLLQIEELSKSYYHLIFSMSPSQGDCPRLPGSAADIPITQSQHVTVTHLI